MPAILDSPYSRFLYAEQKSLCWLSGVAAPFVTRHKAPVTSVAWRRLPAPAPADGCGSTAVLHSLCGAGRLLQWGGSDAKVLRCAS